MAAILTRHWKHSPLTCSQFLSVPGKPGVVLVASETSMSNFLLHNPDCIFIHIPKTGGSTIRRGLWKSYGSPAFGHIPADWPDLFRFAFVRHPLDRFVSAYSDFTQIGYYRGSLADFAAIVTNDSILYDERRKTQAQRIRYHSIPQTHPFNCLSLAQKVYRFERFGDEIARLAARMGLSFGALPHRRRTQHDSWDRLLDRALRRRLVAFYDRDFAELGYPLP